MNYKCFISNMNYSTEKKNQKNNKGHIKAVQDLEKWVKNIICFDCYVVFTR